MAYTGGSVSLRVYLSAGSARGDDWTVEARDGGECGGVIGVWSGNFETEPGGQKGMCLLGMGMGVELDVNVSIPHMPEPTAGVGGCWGVDGRIT